MSQVFDLAEQVGVKKELLDTLKAIMEEHKGQTMDRKFGPDELYFAINMGLSDAGAPNNFEYKQWYTIAKAYLYAFMIGKAIVREMENKNVEVKA